MNMHHDLSDETEAFDDLSTLAWVHDELRRSLESAHKSLRRYLKEAEGVAGSDVDAVDPVVVL
jgi:chemosensory pili system protein ChpA (sensor histidine kinase/response regulator)